MEFSDAPRPTRTRGPKEANPFLEVVQSLEIDGAAKRFVVSDNLSKTATSGRKGRNGEPITEYNATLNKLRAQLSEAGAIHNKTVRIHVEDTGTKTKPTLTVTIYASPKITRGASATTTEE